MYVRKKALKLRSNSCIHFIFKFMNSFTTISVKDTISCYNIYIHIYHISIDIYYYIITHTFIGWNLYLKK